MLCRKLGKFWLGQVKYIWIIGLSLLGKANQVSYVRLILLGKISWLIYIGPGWLNECPYKILAAKLMYMLLKRLW